MRIMQWDEIVYLKHIYGKLFKKSQEYCGQNKVIWKYKYDFWKVHGKNEFS